MLHITEEFLFPGGFIEWYQEWVPSKTAGIRPGYLVWINTLMIGVCVIPAAGAAAGHGYVAWYTVAAIAGANGIFHIVGVIKLKKYSPGVITGMLLYVPLACYGTWFMLSTVAISSIKVIVILAIAAGYHIFSIIRQGK